MAELVARWVRLYTRKLPTPVAERRVEEIGADLHDHIAHERARGAGDRRIALGVLSRMLRGLAADASWRRRQAEATPGYRSSVRIVLGAGALLLLPLLAMQITGAMDWGVFDFVLAGALLAGAGLAFSLVRKPGDIAYRAAVGVALAAAVFLVFLVGAVGVIGTDGDRADLMYGGVLAVGIIGAVLARFRPEGMARALLAMALATALVAVISMIAGKHQAPITSVPELLGLNAMFVALFGTSAWLFRRAARRRPG
jgi:hypothetical protein